MKKYILWGVDRIPISTYKTVLCKNCGRPIKIAKFGDVLGPKEAKILFDSCCVRCEIKHLLNLK